MKKTYPPIQQKLMRIVLVTSGVVLFLTCTAFFIYEFLAFRETKRTQLSTLGKIIASNSTAALAFQDKEAAAETLQALKAEKQIVAACLYDSLGNIFVTYPQNISTATLPQHASNQEYIYDKGNLEGFEPVIQAD